jgi:hypothetical protein
MENLANRWAPVHDADGEDRRVVATFTTRKGRMVSFDIHRFGGKSYVGISSYRTCSDGELIDRTQRISLSTKCYGELRRAVEQLGLHLARQGLL